ncbi:AAA family ATPase, partial [Thalassobaculum sp.]|uniref:AAA family ATPase n=1 Tax=Thalassobaculum sp. TaxID=2022740 RepID=UPI0032EDB035
MSEIEASDPQPPGEVDLGSLTVEQTMGALAAGWTLRVTGGTQTFHLDTDLARKVLRYFLEDQKGIQDFNRPPVRGSAALEVFVSWLDKELDPVIFTPPTTSGANPIWSVRRIEITQFGGLHPYCLEDGSLPAPLVIAIDKPVTVVQGTNGSGKSSITRAISFALTGKVPRSAKGPEDFADVGNPIRLGADELGAWPTVIPIPTPSQHAARSPENDGSEIGTAISLTLSADGRNDRVLTRSVVRNKRGHFESQLTVDANPVDSVEQALSVSALAIEMSVLRPLELPIIGLATA